MSEAGGDKQGTDADDAAMATTQSRCQEGEETTSHSAMRRHEEVDMAAIAHHLRSPGRGLLPNKIAYWRGVRR